MRLSGQRAVSTAILGLFQKGDHVITTVCEHNSVLRPLYRLQKQGVEVSFLSADEQGILDYDKLPALIKENTKAVCPNGKKAKSKVDYSEKYAGFYTIYSRL